jgi:two-component system, NarL family, response regulator LiaR
MASLRPGSYNGGMRKTSVLLVDDNPLFIEHARALLSRESDIEVVGIASSGEEAIALVERLAPRVVLMDIAMPGMDGLETTRRLKALAHPPAVLMVTLHGDVAYRAAAAAAGAQGLLCKDDFATAVLSALRRVGRGVAERGGAPE